MFLLIYCHFKIYLGIGKRVGKSKKLQPVIPVKQWIILMMPTFKPKIYEFQLESFIYVHSELNDISF